MRLNLKYLYSAIAAIVLAMAPSVSAANFLDRSPAKRFLEVDVHALGGAFGVTQDYMSRFPEIQNVNVDMGASFGLGARAVFGLKEYLGLGTAIDFTLNDYDVDMSVVSMSSPAVSTISLDNRAYYVNLPVFASFRFNVGRSIRWCVDAGFYYAYGIGGRQKQQIIRTEITPSGQQTEQKVYISTDYFHSRDSFINGFNRGDFGLHLATYFNLGPHLIVGARYQIGAKNAARKIGIVNPSIHNQFFHAVIGYRF